MKPMESASPSSSFTTRGGIVVTRSVCPADPVGAVETLIDAIDERRGALYASMVDQPGRYSRWTVGFVDPPLALSARGRAFRLDALNPRGAVLLALLADTVRAAPGIADCSVTAQAITGTIAPATVVMREEERSRQSSVFSLVRAVMAAFAAPDDAQLGLYGAFGYDLVFQFEAMPQRLERADDQRDVVLYLPDALLVVDHARQAAEELFYDFAGQGLSTAGMPRVSLPARFRPAPSDGTVASDHGPGAYAANVELARGAFARGDLFEAVMSQTFSTPCTQAPATIFRRLRETNPAPYGALINLGEGEFLVSASPEMFVRVQGRRVETCPISGTAARGSDALADARNIRDLLNSEKDEAELTMCTDVDRNDKARICEAGSVKVIGRRQIEMTNRLIHTVDHVEGILRPGFDALDAFLTHAWAVTVTGAPKPGAMRFIEAHERSARRWYGGAIGFVSFDGSMNTGLTLRTVRLHEGVAEVRAGATLLYDSVAEAEDAECRLKASALLACLSPTAPKPGATLAIPRVAARVLLVDHEDSFVHMLADYVRQTGADVTTVRHDQALDALEREHPDVVLLSPGPGRPDDFAMRRLLDTLVARGLPVFGVCLGLQGLAEYFGGRLLQLNHPVHGRGTPLCLRAGRFIPAVDAPVQFGRYHSLYADPDRIPHVLDVLGDAGGVPMAIEHRTLPIAAVQFHPESILSGSDHAGLRLLATAMHALAGARA